MTVETTFEEQGSLHPPGPIGRLVRLLLGSYCVYAAYSFLVAWGHIQANGFPLNQTTIIAWLVALWLVPAVVNIGWTRDWHRRPQFAVVGISLALAGYHWATSGAWMGQALSIFSVAWLIYLFAHLGISFLIATVIATPGCEMRSIPHLWGKLTGNATREHFCPGPLHRLDRWEHGRKGASGAG